VPLGPACVHSARLVADLNGWRAAAFFMRRQRALRAAQSDGSEKADRAFSELGPLPFITMRMSSFHIVLT
jgi:hypothetical protein